jgi:hypothetical protein
MTNLKITKNPYGEQFATFDFEGMKINVEQGRGFLFFKRIDYELDKEQNPAKKIVADSLIKYHYVANIFMDSWPCDAFKVSKECLDRLKVSALDVINQMGYIK